MKLAKTFGGENGPNGDYEQCSCLPVKVWAGDEGSCAVSDVVAGRRGSSMWEDECAGAAPGLVALPLSLGFSGGGLVAIFARILRVASA